MYHQRSITLNTSGNLNVYNYIKNLGMTTAWLHSSSQTSPHEMFLLNTLRWGSKASSSFDYVQHQCCLVFASPLTSCKLIRYVTGLTRATKLACSPGLPFSMHLRSPFALKLSVNFSDKMLQVVRHAVSTFMFLQDTCPSTKKTVIYSLDITVTRSR